jgi:hypothetical protein
VRELRTPREATDENAVPVDGVPLTDLGDHEPQRFVLAVLEVLVSV